MKAYYAHSIALYGTKQETRDVETLTRLGFVVVNPNCPACDAGYKADGMAYFDRLIAECDLVAFRANPDGSINAGVAYEIKCAEDKGLPIIELPSNILRRELSVEETRQLLREGGAR
jgi:hypothetical protein